MIGIDIIAIARIKRAASLRFIEKVFSHREIDYFRSKKMAVQTIAGHWVAKEAFIKAMESMSGFSLRDIEVLRRDGVPYIRFRGHDVDCSVSISHCKEYAVAVVVKKYLEFEYSQAT